MNKKEIIVSGIQPTGNLHIGNYLGAVKKWVELQNSGKYEMYIFIADLHALTGKMTADELRTQINKTCAELLAAGIDPKKTTFFVQSHIQEHAELAWIFNCVTPINELERMTQYKDKVAQFKNATAGLFTYPILQAADILLYHGDLVPVGQDQIQHVELTRDTARWFNNKYEQYFPETKHLLTPTPKIMSLLEPNKKMSKSLGQDHVIELSDEPEIIENKIKKAVTATEGGGVAPGVANLLVLIKEFGDQKTYEKFIQMEKDKTIRYGDLKKELGEAVGKYFSNFRTERAKLLRDEKKLTKIMSVGTKKAKKVAEKTMIDIRKIIGLK
ncbi:MAG: tryptophan--tRNA ligase [Candidatus Magasanikbacteria bacterium CG10_big_fil_rev_8_21_14_0_10_36_32]|uniref:Tryptophan--tRNA ligase n=1 Tax=Candidatus Magasanikbacteria bacterium CG10_big_fil_rev_8_21_14_0_10_36_32 TaxID=1974646 RepID=A0A2M6W6R0_9BACT|nr:MAG: tryptophan--tRNA ligase [Candidatus Magasanikbacteria bacterium CG10_big_fil_rev_8_21_14_0_10_36_32]